MLLARVKAGRSEKSLLMTGLRGVGKTVLLNEIERLAVRDAYRTIHIEAHEEKRLSVMLAPHLRRLLYELDRIAGTGDKVRRGIRVLKSFVSTIKVSYGDVEFGLDTDPEKALPTAVISRPICRISLRLLLRPRKNEKPQ